MADPGPGEQARAQAARTSPVFLTLAGLLFLGIVTLPCALGYALHPAGTVFLGFVEDWPDTLNYFSFVEQARHGHALAALSAGPSPGKTYLFSSLCYLMGLLCRLTGLEPPEAHLLTRLVFAALLVPALWWFLRDALEDGPAARFALLSILFGSGFGFLVPPGSEVLHPTDLWHVGTIAIYACASLAHLAASWWTLVLAYLCLGRAFERDSLRWAVAGGAALAANGSLHPYHFVSACAVAALAAGVEGPSRRSFALAAGFLGTGGLAFGVQLYLVVSQPLMREVAAQSMNLSPPPWDYLLGFGLAGVLGLAALVDWRRLPGSQRVAAYWVAACVPLLYSFHTPLTIRFERRFADVLFVPLATLAAGFLFRRVMPAVARARGEGTVPLVAVLLVILQVPSNLSVVGGFCAKVRRGLEPYTLPAAEFEAARTLRQLAGPTDTVLCHVPANLFLPGLSGVLTVPGHPHWRRDHHRLVARALREFWGQPSGATRAAFLADTGATLVYVGGAEREALGFEPSKDPVLERIYSGAGVAIYRVRLPARAAGGKPVGRAMIPAH